MKKVYAEALTKEAFAPYGYYMDAMNPSGMHWGGPFNTFFPDRAEFYHDGSNTVGVCTLTVKKDFPRQIVKAEYHNHSCEAILPLNDDAVVHVTCAGKGFDVNYTKAFIVPKGTMVVLKPGVFHTCAIPLNVEEMTALLLLEERTYARDCIVVELDENNQFEIVTD